MPYPNEHAARLTNPDKYDEFRRKNDFFEKGIHAIFGIYNENGKRKSELHSIRFDAKKFTPAEAKEWLKEHGIKYIEFEEATGEGKKEIDLSGKRFTRQLVEMTSSSADEDVIEMSVSSEELIHRGFFIEILEHNENSIDYTYFDAGAAVLLNHNLDKQIGAIKNYRLDKENKKLRVSVKFSKSALAQEIKRDIADGIRRFTSVGYFVIEAKRDGEKDGLPIIRVKKWMPVEVSITSLPADITVGVGRSGVSESKTIKKEMSEQTETKETNQNIMEILELGKLHNRMENAYEFIKNGKTAEEFKNFLLENLKSSPLDIGTTEKDKSEYSFVRAILAAATGDWRTAPLEKELSDAVAKTLNRTPKSFFVPPEVLYHKRQLLKGAAGAGLVGKELIPEAFIEVLRDKLVIKALGAQTLDGLVGDVLIPKQTARTTAGWVAEGNTLPGSPIAFTQVQLAPKTVGAQVPYSRKLLIQATPDVETLVRDDLAAAIAEAIDRAAIRGNGTNEPRGILNTEGVAIIPIGQNGGPPAWSHIVALETAISIQNADVGALAYLTNPKVRGKLKTTEKASQTAQFIWGDYPVSPELFGLVNGYKAAVTNLVPSDLTKGTGENLSAIIFGNFNDIVIATWGVLDILVDPYSLSSQLLVKVVAYLEADVLIRKPESFAVIKDASTV